MTATISNALESVSPRGNAPVAAGACSPWSWPSWANVGAIAPHRMAVTARARSARPKWESIPVFLNLNRHCLRAAQGWPSKLSVGADQIECLGGRLSDSGLRSGPIRDGANATRLIARGNGASSTGLGSAAAQQAAHANEQQLPTQLRSEAGRVPDSFH